MRLPKNIRKELTICLIIILLQLTLKNIRFLHRFIISKALHDGDSKTTITKELGFSRQAIHNEISRGTVEHMKTDLSIKYVYDPYAAKYKHNEAAHYKGR